MNELIIVAVCIVAAMAVKSLFQADSEPKVLSLDQKRNLILGVLNPSRKRNGRVSQEEMHWASLVERYKLSYILSQQNEKVEFELGHEQVRATESVITSATKNTKVLEDMCLNEFEIDIRQLAFGNKDEADLRKVFKAKNL